jgi:hypothetical protein
MKHLVLVMAIGVMTVLVSPFLLAQVAPTLGTAAQFALLGNSAVTGSTGAGTVVSGDVGSFPTATISNFPPSTVTPGFTLHNSANAIVQQAQADARASYTFLAAQGGTPINANLSTNGALSPGVYSVGAADLPASSTMTLNGSGIFIFNVASSLTMNVGSSIIGSANPCNVYWRVGSSATLNGTSFMGTVLADASITLGGGNVTGRLLAGLGATGAVTLSVGGNTVGGCSAPPIAPTVTKAFAPASIVAGATSQLTITINNPNTFASSLTSVLTDTLPTGVLIASTPGATTTCGGAVSAAAGGSTVSLASGSTLPAGSCTIMVNVTAPVAGTYLNTIVAGALQTSTGSNAAPASATLIVTAVACPVITLTPATMPNGLVGQAFSQTLTASGGTAPYTFSVASGALPTGTTLSVAGGLGLVSGTPTTNGTYTFTIRASDANNCGVDRAYTVIITTSVPTMPEMFLILLALVLTSVGYLHLRKS